LIHFSDGPPQRGTSIQTSVSTKAMQNKIEVMRIRNTGQVSKDNVENGIIPTNGFSAFE
jgi:hypothetical protein